MKIRKCVQTIFFYVRGYFEMSVFELTSQLYSETTFEQKCRWSYTSSLFPSLTTSLGCIFALKKKRLFQFKAVTIIIF